MLLPAGAFDQRQRRRPIVAGRLAASALYVQHVLAHVGRRDCQQLRAPLPRRILAETSVAYRPRWRGGEFVRGRERVHRRAALSADGLQPVGDVTQTGLL